MADVKLTSDEVALLKATLSKLVVRERTGEVGILHGADRFVSTQLILRKTEREVLAALAAKVGARVGADKA